MGEHQHPEPGWPTPGLKGHTGKALSWVFTELSRFGFVKQVLSRKRTLGPLSFMLK